MDKKRVALQESSPGWSDSVTPGIGIVIIRGIGASDSVAFYTTVGIIERSGRLRSKSSVADNLFPWVRSRLRHALTHGYSLESLRDSVIRPYFNRIARTVRPYNLGINTFLTHPLPTTLKLRAPPRDAQLFFIRANAMLLKTPFIEFMLGEILAALEKHQGNEIIGVNAAATPLDREFSTVFGNEFGIKFGHYCPLKMDEVKN